MGMSLIIVLLVLAVAGAYFFLRRPKASSGSGHKQSQTAADDEHRIHGIRRSGHDKREEVRFEPEKNPRRTGSGRRVEDKLWDNEK